MKYEILEISLIPQEKMQDLTISNQHTRGLCHKKHTNGYWMHYKKECIPSGFHEWAGSRPFVGKNCSKNLFWGRRQPSQGLV